MVLQRSTVARHSSNLGLWEIAWARVPWHLRSYVRSFGGYRFKTRPLRTREMPTGSLWLIVSFGDPLDIVTMADRRLAGARLVSFAVGLQDALAVTEHAGRQHGVQVELTPLGARAVLGAPPRELAGTCVGLDDLLGREADRLAARLAEAPDWADRFAILTGFLERRIDAGVALVPEVNLAWQRLQESAGRVSVAELTREAGWSRRHLVARFREQVGMPPKTVARILRFQRAISLSNASARPSWAEIAAVCGYSDQSHLIRDFKAFAGSRNSDQVDSGNYGGSDAHPKTPAGGARRHPRGRRGCTE